ncbi:unnamed protein product [Gongylonema pulchrum]|uniref:Uncharacterized protein n=1 Tax=Gongylonema pulchrum TaxID=637853 RepID=A0A183DVI1_9BILA|nr:unnamed protein product [Gongylonema pulchrum]
MHEYLGVAADIVVSAVRISSKDWLSKLTINRIRALALDESIIHNRMGRLERISWKDQIPNNAQISEPGSSRLNYTMILSNIHALKLLTLLIELTAALCYRHCYVSARNELGRHRRDHFAERRTTPLPSSLCSTHKI